MSTVTDGDGDVTTINRDGQGNPTSITSHDGQTTTLGLDANGYLNAITNPKSEAYTFEYTALGLMENMKDPKLNETVFGYDSEGRLTTDTAAKNTPQEATQTLARTGTRDNYTVTLTSELGRASTFQVEENPAQGILVKRTNTDPNGLTTITELDQNQNETITSPDGSIIEVTKKPDPRFGMASPLQTLKVTLPSTLEANITTTRTIDFGQNSTGTLDFDTLTDTLNINGRIFTSVFTQATKTFTDISAESRTTTTVVDAQGRITSSSIPEIFDTTFAYDTRGRLQTINQGSGAGLRTSTIEYYDNTAVPAHQEGFVKSVTDAEGRVVSFEYDAVGRVTKQTLPDLREINFTYDANGNVTSITPPGRPAHAFDYNAVNLEDEYTPPNIGLIEHRTFFEYNLDKQPTLITRPDKQGIRFNYEAGGRLDTFEVLDDVTLQTPAVLSTTDFHYDSAGRLDFILAPGNEKIEFGYDGSLPKTTTWSRSGNNVGSVSREYDNSFRITSRTATDSAATPVSMVARFKYDDDDLLEEAIYDPDGTENNGDEITLELTNDPDNGLLQNTFIGMVHDSIEYIESGQTEGFGELLHYKAWTDAGGTLSDKLETVFERDKLGRITKKTETLNGTVTHVFDYTYDAAGRLDTVSKDTVLKNDYEYDLNSNRISIDGGTTINATYDDQDRLETFTDASSTNWTFKYTDNGELERKYETGNQAATEIIYDYDVLGNLRGVDFQGTANDIEYIIDGRNRRIGRIKGSNEKHWLYKDQLNPIAELNSTGNVTKRFIYASRANVPDMMIIPTGLANAGTYRIISDHLGSPRFIIDIGDGSKVLELSYDEWGNETVEFEDTAKGITRDLIPFGFAGGLYDEDTGLVRFGARDYDPEIGRWTSKDPISFKGIIVNSYDYGFNDPLNLVDDTGLLPYPAKWR